jgi:hypothetical protein
MLMTPGRAIAIGQVAEAVRKGKKVSYIDRNGSRVYLSRGEPIDLEVCYDISEEDISKHRPWTLDEAIEMVGTMVRTKGPVVDRLLITGASTTFDNMVVIKLGDFFLSAEDVFKQYETIDGEICGERVY